MKSDSQSQAPDGVAFNIAVWMRIEISASTVNFVRPYSRNQRRSSLLTSTYDTSAFTNVAATISGYRMNVAM